MVNHSGLGSLHTRQLNYVCKVCVISMSNYRSMGYNPSDLELKLMIEDADIDKSGSIEFSEFVIMMALKIKDVPSDEEMRDIFRGKSLLLSPVLLASFLTLFFCNIINFIVPKCQ